MRVFTKFCGKNGSFWLVGAVVLVVIGGDLLLGRSLRGSDQVALKDLLADLPNNGARPQVGARPGDGARRQDEAESSDQKSLKSERLARALMDRVLEYLTWGPPLEAKLRMRAWAAGQAVTEVGRYEQAGQGTGRTSMDLHVPIADGNARWQQTCDGRLAWTREELGKDVLVRRVDLGLLEELLLAAEKAKKAELVAAGEQSHDQPLSEFGNVSPRFRVGGLAEIVDRIQADYELSISEGFIENVRMLVVKGTMRESVIGPLKQASGGSLSPLVPQHVRVAIEADAVDSPLPSRIEFWSEPAGKLISLLEIYDVTTIEAPPAERFRFEAGGDEYLQETDLYLRRFGARD